MIAHTVAQVCALFVSSSSPCLMRKLSDSLSTSPSISLSSSSFPLSSCTSYCLSPSSSLMSWSTTTRTPAEELGPPDKKNSSTIILEKMGPLKDRSDFNDALTTLNRLHQESGERQLRPVPFWKYQHWQQSSSSSSSWWQWSDSWWSS